MCARCQEKIAGTMMLFDHSFDVVSFDVFDTLLTRACGTPQAVFAAIERETGRKGFAQAREAAECKANRMVARTGCGETSLEEIYSYIPEFDDLRERELAFERETLRANPEMVGRWEEAGRLGKKRVICSDMYLPRAFIEERLHENGIAGWDAIYVSSERKARKATGRLFDLMLTELNVSPDLVLHIGDNRRSDVQRPNEKGIAAYQYCRGVESGIMRSFAPKIAWAKVIEEGWRQFGSSDYWERVGYVYAGVLGYAYARFVGDEAKRRGISRLLLVYRDGYNLEPILNELYPEIKTTQLYAPRQTYFYAAQDFTDKPHQIRARREMLWRQLALAGDESERARFFSTGYLSEANQARFDAASAQARREYADYLATLKIESAEKVGLVDMTTSALSATKLVEMTLGREVTSFYLLTYKPAVKNKPGRVVSMFHAHGSSIIFTLMSEFLFTAPTPTVKDIRDCQPRFGSSGGSYDEFKIAVCKKMRNSIVASAKYLAAQKVRIDPGELIDYFEAFHAAVTARDESEFSFAREATSIEQKVGKSPLQRDLRSVRPILRIFGRTAVSAKVFVRGLRRFVTFYLLGRYPFVVLPFGF